MCGFGLTGSAWTCDGVPLSAIAAAVGTPAYVYSAATIRDRLGAFSAGFASYPHAIHYALKANSNLAVVRVVRAAGGLVDANSGGEIDVALRAGYAPGDIVLTGVGKTPAEIDRAVALGVKAINAESSGELDRIAAVARARQTIARVALRVNPDVAADSHPHISTGLSTHKFGVPIGSARAIAPQARARGGRAPARPAREGSWRSSDSMCTSPRRCSGWSHCGRRRQRWSGWPGSCGTTT
jgi:diaminopimelate decarboxylase